MGWLHYHRSNGSKKILFKNYVLLDGLKSGVKIFDPADAMVVSRVKENHSTNTLLVSRRKNNHFSDPTDVPSHKEYPSADPTVLSCLKA